MVRRLVAGPGARVSRVRGVRRVGRAGTTLVGLRGQRCAEVGDLVLAAGCGHERVERPLVERGAVRCLLSPGVGVAQTLEGDDLRTVGQARLVALGALAPIALVSLVARVVLAGVVLPHEVTGGLLHRADERDVAGGREGDAG